MRSLLSWGSTSVRTLSRSGGTSPSKRRGASSEPEQDHPGPATHSIHLPPREPAPTYFQSKESKCIFNKPTIKVCLSCSWCFPGTSVPSVAHLTVSLILCSSRGNAWGESRALQGRHYSSRLFKFKGLRQTRRGLLRAPQVTFGTT